jgi:hypothetical protein
LRLEEKKIYVCVQDSREYLGSNPFDLITRSKSIIGLGARPGTEVLPTVGQFFLTVEISPHGLSST